jgi:uncharacterized protein DUF3761
MRFMRVWLTVACVACTFAPGAADISSAAQRKPNDATALCVDGTYSKAQSQQGACSSHGGVKTWYGATSKAESKSGRKETKTDARADRTEAKVARTERQAERKVTRTEEKADRKIARTQDREDNVRISPRRVGAPADATAKCKDGTYSDAAQHRGACSNHGGVAEWYK